MNARVRNFRAKFCAKFRENRTFRIRTLYRLREIRTLWHTAQDTLVPGPGHYGARHSLRVSGAGEVVRAKRRACLRTCHASGRASGVSERQSESRVDASRMLKFSTW